MNKEVIRGINIEDEYLWRRLKNSLPKVNNFRQHRMIMLGLIETELTFKK